MREDSIAAMAILLPTVFVLITAYKAGYENGRDETQSIEDHIRSSMRDMGVCEYARDDFFDKQVVTGVWL